MLTSEGESWKTQRYSVNKIFAKKSIKDYMTLMENETINVICDLSLNENVNMSKMSSEITMNIVNKILFGNMFENEEKHEMVRIVNTINDEIMKYLNPIHNSIRHIPFYGKELRKSTKHIRETIERTLDTVVEKADISEFMGTILEMKTKNEAIDQILTFFLAGYDTSASTITWALYLLHKKENEKYLEHIREELKYKDESLMLINVIKETLRLYPAGGGGFLRKYKGESGFPEEWALNSDIIVPVYSMHRHPEYWISGDEFLPKRWELVSEGDMTNIFMPFSQGSRNCVGKHFAMLEIYCVLSTILQNVRFKSTTQDIESILTPVLTGDKPLEGTVSYQSLI